LANANQVRDCASTPDFAHALIAIARELYIGDSFGIDLQTTVYALGLHDGGFVLVSVSLGQVPQRE